MFSHHVELADFRRLADELAQKGLKEVKSIKRLRTEEHKIRNNITFHKMEVERQKGYFLADADESEAMQKKLRRVRFDINVLEEEEAQRRDQVQKYLAALNF